MPKYEYYCVACCEYFELEMSIKEDSGPRRCGNYPRCEEGMERQISLSSFSLKGRGWAKDGYQ